MAGEVGVEIDGFDELAKRSELFAEKVRSAGIGLDEPVDDAVESVSEDILETAKEIAPTESGALIASGSVKRTGSLGQREVVFDADHAGAVEYGSIPSAPYTIEPDEADALRFTVEERRLVEFQDQDYVQVVTDEKVVITDSVQHPGVEAQPYLRPSLRLHRHNVAEKIDEALDEHLDKFFGST